ncbi:MAG: SufD family Fe-S cluster assembly protein [Candidatus Moraniibacteriota bacterium]
MQFFNLINTRAQKIVLRREQRVFFFWNESRHIEFSFEKPGTTAHIFALFIGNDTDAFTLSVIQNHKKSDTSSFLTVLSILDGHARLSYDGLIRIEEGAVRTDTAQTNRNLLLSEHSRASTSPRLEILADDVSARHASATGTTNLDARFTLETRGIERISAERLLAEGTLRNFFDEMRAYTRDPEVDALEKEALEKLSIHPHI